MTEKLAKELRDSANAAYIAHCPTDIVVILRKAADELDRRAALDVPAGEREKLAQWMEDRGNEAFEDGFDGLKNKCDRIAQLLRTPTVTEAMARDAFYEFSKHYPLPGPHDYDRDIAAMTHALQAAQAQRTGEDDNG